MSLRLLAHLFKRCLSRKTSHIRVAMKWPDFLLFASDATLTGIWAGLLLLVALFSMWAEHRRHRRKSIDQVGWFPWTKVFFICTLLGVTLMTMAIKGWVSPPG